MINLLNCRRCGRPLLPGARADTLFCSGACRAAQHRAMRAGGDILPFISSIPMDDDQVAEAAARALVAPFAHLAGGDLSPEAAMAEVHQAEQRLLMARRAAKKVYKKAGLETAFDGPFVLRETAERWRAEARAEVSKKPESAWEQEKAERAKLGIEHKPMSMDERVAYYRQPLPAERRELPAQAIEGKAAVCDPTRRRGRPGGRSRNRRNHHRFLKAVSAPATKPRPSPPRRTRHFELYA